MGPFSARVFISHTWRCSTSQRLIEALVPALEEAGLTVLIDASLDRGEEFRPEILTWLAQCDGAIVLMSPEALDSRWVCREAEHLVMRRHGGDDVLIVPWMLDGVTWQDVEGRFEVGRLSELLGLSGADHDCQDVAARFLEVSAIRVALGRALVDLPVAVRQEIVRQLRLDGRGVDVSDVEGLVRLARQHRVYGQLLEIIEARRRTTRAAGDLDRGLAGLTRLLDGHADVARALGERLGATTSAEIAAVLVEDAVRTLEALVGIAGRHRQAAQTIAQLALPWTPLWRGDARAVAAADAPRLVAVHGLHPALASLPLAARVGAPAGISRTQAGLVSRHQLGPPAAMHGDLRPTAEVYADGLCQQIMAGYAEVAPGATPEVRRLMARGALRRMQSIGLDPQQRQFRYVVDELDDVLRQVAAQLPELFVVIMEPPPMADPERVMEHGEVLPLLTTLFALEGA